MQTGSSSPKAVGAGIGCAVRTCPHHKSRVSCQKGSICYGVGPFWQDTIEICNCWATYDIRISCINSLWPNATIWIQSSVSTLVHVMACCLTAPSHYLKQCWLLINEVLWHSPKGNFIGSAQDICPRYEFENYKFNITTSSTRGQRV